jgi:hypothetical protein
LIVFNFHCENRHSFEGWFASSDDFERQLSDKQLTCPVCGNTGISRLPHAVHVKTTGSERTTRKAAKASGRQHYTNVAQEMLGRLVEHIIENTEDVGAAFPEEARKIHYQEVPDRRIRGTASHEEVEALKDEGVDVMAIPVPAHRMGKAH